MGYYSKVAVATNKEGMEKILDISREVMIEPSVREASYTEADGTKITDYILVWEWVKWYTLPEYGAYQIEEVIKGLSYYDYVILNEDGTYEESYGESRADSPHILGLEIGYYNYGTDEWVTL